MKVSTYKAFEKLNGRIDVLEQKIDALIALGDQDAVAGRVAADLNRSADSLNKAIPAAAGQAAP